MAKILDLSHSFLELTRDGTASLVRWESGPPPQVDGFVIGAPLMTRNAPHGGEMHPDGDEVLFLVSGRIEVILEESGSETVVEVMPGEALASTAWRVAPCCAARAQPSRSHYARRGK